MDIPHSGHAAGAARALLSAHGVGGNTTTSSAQRFVFRLNTSEKDALLRVLQDCDSVHGDNFIWEQLHSIGGFLGHLQMSLDKWRNQLPVVDDQEAVSRHASRLIVKMSQQAYVLALPNMCFVRDIILHSSTAISGGGYADIFVGKLRGQDVALKRVRISTTDMVYEIAIQNLIYEALTWRQLQHANVLPFLGIDIMTFNSVPCLISPWMPLGNILKYVHGQNSAGHATLCLIERLSLEIINGLVYLHSQSVVHGDLRGVNILIDARTHARISDLGLSCIVTETVTQSVAAVSRRGSTRWMAPEQLNAEGVEVTSGFLTQAIDIYSFACVLFELYTLKVPFFRIKADTAVALKVMQGKHPEKPDQQDCIIDIPSTTWTFMQECWSANPATRIKTSELIYNIPIHEHVAIPEGTISAQNTYSVLCPVQPSTRSRIVTLLSHQTDLDKSEDVYQMHGAANRDDEVLLQALLFLGSDIEALNDLGERPLHCAARNGCESIVKTLLLHGAEVDARDQADCTALHLAVINCHEAVSAALLFHGADINTLDKIHNTPLHKALQWANGAASERLFKTLLSHSANIDVHIRDTTSRTLLHRAVQLFDNTIIVHELLSRGADVHALDSKQRTPLHWASFKGNESVVTTLLLRGSDAKARDREGCTPTYLAAKGGFPSVIIALLSHGADFDARDKNHDTTLQEALEWADSAASETLLETLLLHGADVDIHDSNRTLLHRAIWLFNNAMIFHELLSRGADVHARDDEQRTPLHWASSKGNESVVTTLLLHGSDANARDHEGCTPTHLAAKGGFPSIINTLMLHGSDANARDHQGCTPMHLAAKGGFKLVIIALLSHGADVNARDNHQNTPLHEALQWTNSLRDMGERGAEALVLHGADFHARNSTNTTPLHLAASWCTPLHLASLGGNQCMVNALISHGHGSDVDARNHVDLTLIDVESKGDFLNMIIALLSQGADISAGDENHNAPLHTVYSEALQCGGISSGMSGSAYQPVVETLLSRDADVSARDIGDCTALPSVSDEHISAVRDICASDEHQDTPGHEALHKLKLN